jgi:acetyltransferase-like isoleucine patch superfamily enzyme
MDAIKNLVLVLIKSIRNYTQRLVLWRNFHYSNSKALRRGQIQLIKETPKCNQLTKVTGSGKVKIGIGCSFGYKLGGRHRCGYIEIQPRYSDSRIEIGDNVLTNNNLFICAANYVSIGDNTLIGEHVTIIDHEAHGIHPNERRKIGEIGKVVIGKNVWVGNDVTILKNSSIGDNSIIAASAVISGKFPPNVIIGGIPARVIKSIDESSSEQP